MLVSWENKAGLQSGEVQDSKDVFQELVTDFWDGLGLLFVRHADNEEADPQALEGIATLLEVSMNFENLLEPVSQISVAVVVV